MSSRNTTIEISKEYLHFAAGHFTIFSETEREDLHGHNFHIALDATAPIGDDGLTFDYNILKNELKTLCDALDEKTLMPTESPYLTIERDDQYTYAVFNGERIPFLDRDVLLLPIRNVTVEELAAYLLGQLIDALDLHALEISALTLRCASGAGQWATADWQVQR